MLPVEFAEKMERLLGAEEWDALLAAWERPRAGMAARLTPDGGRGGAAPGGLGPCAGALGRVRLFL